MEKYGIYRQAIDDDVIRLMRSACWITKATDTHSEYVILIAFHCNSGYMNASQCYGLRTLPVLFELSYFRSSRRLAHLERQHMFIQVC